MPIPESEAVQPVVTPARKPSFRTFRSAAPKLTKEQADRQGRVTQAAFGAFADRDRLKAFLNHHHDELGGRPLDVAIASDDGLVAVQAAILRAAASVDVRPDNAFDRASAAHGPVFPTD